MTEGTCRFKTVFAAALAVAAFLAAGLAPAVEGAMTDEERRIIREKCTLCHTDERILTSDPAGIRKVLDAMVAKNPGFFADVQTDALSAALEKMLNDPEVAARRKAWDGLVARGEALFSDPSLGTSGKSCASCHTTDSLKGVVPAYPKFDRKLNRHVSLLDKVNMMISSNMLGRELPLGDPRTTALEAYLKSLR